MDWASLLAGSVIGGLVTWVVTHLYSRRGDRAIALLPERIAQELVQRGLINPERETEARAAARDSFLSWATSDAPPLTQAEMNEASYRDFKEADLELQRTYGRLYTALGPEDRQRLNETQEAWRSFRDKQIRLAGGFYEGGSIQPLLHNTAALKVTEARCRDLQQLHDEIRLRQD
jgi:uncharacterized protein YecT (DUF1311 family)